MKKYTFLFLFSILPFILSAQWVPQTSGTNLDLYSVCFTDTLNGWATGGWWTSGSHGIILHTDDGGENWEEQTSGTSNDLLSVYFTDSTHGWAAGSTTMPYTGILYRTSDGGNNWEELDDGVIPVVHEIYFSNIFNGWAAAKNILHTTDGGETWETQLFLDGSVLSVCFTDSLNGWVSGGDYTGSTGYNHCIILHTNDGGDSWDYQYEYNSWDGYILHSICFTDSLNGWSAGGDGGYKEIILKTTDGGNNWDTSYINNYGSLNSISFADSFNGLAVGEDGSIISTTDGGNTWETTPSGTGLDLNSVYFTENGYGWVVGTSGIILHADYSQTVGLNEFEVQSLKSKVRCYPNPFTTSTTIEYELQQPSTIQITIYNHLGKQIEVIQQTQSAGKQQVVWNADGLPGGVYFCTIQTESGTQTMKMIKMK